MVTNLYTVHKALQQKTNKTGIESEQLRLVVLWSTAFCSFSRSDFGVIIEICESMPLFYQLDLESTWRILRDDKQTCKEPYTVHS